MLLALHLLIESSLLIPSVFPELQKATRNARVTVGPVFLVSGWGWRGGGAGLARTQRWEGGGRRGVVCPRRQMARGAGPWWAGAGRAPCAVVGNWGPGWNVGGTLILSATVVLRHRSPLPPPICSFHRSYGKRSCTHMHTHKNIHRRSHTHTYVRDCPLLICSFGFSCSAAAAALPPTFLLPILQN